MEKRNLFLLALVLVAIFCLSLTACGSNQNSKFGCSDTLFVSAIWKKEYIQRGRMANDLINNRRLTGKNRDSILNLLGKPSEDDPTFVDYLIDMNCGKKKYGLMLLYIEIDSTNNLVTDCFLTD